MPTDLAPSLEPFDILALYGAPTLDGFIDQAFRTLSHTISCAYVSVLYQRFGDAFLRERDSRSRLWTGSFMRKYVELTPMMPALTAKRGVRILTTAELLKLSDASLRQTTFYQHVMQPQGWRHGAYVCFWAERAGSLPICILALYRTADRSDFSDDDLARIQNIHAILAPAVARFHQISSLNAVGGGAMALRHVSPGVVVLDWQLRVLQANSGGRQACAEWNRLPPLHAWPPASDRLAVPRCLMQACRTLRRGVTAASRQHNAPAARRQCRVPHPDAAGRLASVTLVGATTESGGPSFVIEFAASDDAAICLQDSASPLGALTRSECELARVVSEGISYREAAERLGQTVHGVKFLLHRIYRKLNVDNHAQLILLLNGRTSPLREFEVVTPKRSP